jgi:hypothetical protein
MTINLNMLGPFMKNWLDAIYKPAWLSQNNWIGVGAENPIS